MVERRRRRSSRRTPVRRSSSFPIPIRLVIGLGVLLVAGIVSLFTVSSDDVLKYNDDLVDYVNSMNENFAPFVGHLNVYESGEEADVSKMKKDRAVLEKKIKKLRSKVSAYSVPDDELCRKFHASVKAYMENARDFCERYKKVNAYVAKHNPGSDEDRAKVNSMLQKLNEKDQSLLRKVQSSQRKMAEKHGLIIMPDLNFNLN